MRRCRARDPGGRGRHRHRQDLRLSRAGAALGAARADLHRHAHAAGPAVPGTCRCWRGLGRPARVALLKGRANYLCRSRLGRTRAAGNSCCRAAADALLARIRAGRPHPQRRSGGAAGSADTHPLRAAGHLDARELLSARAVREIARCHVVRRAARRWRPTSSIVNHHLLLADLALKEDGFGDLLLAPMP